jgi:RNA polymerase sigma-70 factor (sigma-E family)
VGDDEAFTAFVAGQSRRLVAHARYLGVPTDEAPDLVQDVLVRCYPRWRRIAAADPYAYVARGVTNACVDRLRRRGRRPEVVVASVPDTVVAAPDAASAALDEALRLLAVLPQREREVVVLRYFADLTQAQVAEHLGIAVGTVKSTHASALERLRASGLVGLEGRTP